MEDPLKIYSPESEPTEASKVETTEKVETTPVVNGAANGKDESTPVPEAGVTSRSGRKIKPKKFADEISSPFAEQLLTALKASQSPPKKRKASVDSSVGAYRRFVFRCQFRWFGIYSANVIFPV